MGGSRAEVGMMSHERSCVVFFLLALSGSVAIRRQVVNKALLHNHQQLNATINTMLRSRQTAGNAMELLNGKLQELENSLRTNDMIVTIQNYDEFASYYSQEHDMDFDNSKQFLMDGQFTGETVSSGKIYLMSNDYIRHDIIHEMIHSLHSGPSSQFKAWTNQKPAASGDDSGLDECFTEYYAKKLCTLSNTVDSPNAYPKQMRFMRELESLLVREIGQGAADDVLFHAFWTTYSIDGLAEAIARILIDKGRNANPDTHPDCYNPGDIKNYEKKLQKAKDKARKHPNKIHKPVKPPKMIFSCRNVLKYKPNKANDLKKATTEAKRMLLRWSIDSRNIFWKVIGMASFGQ